MAENALIVMVTEDGAGCRPHVEAPCLSGPPGGFHRGRASSEIHPHHVIVGADLGSGTASL